MGLQMRQYQRGDPSCVKDGLLDWSGDITLLEPSLEELYNYTVVVGAAPSIAHVDLI